MTGTPLDTPTLDHIRALAQAELARLPAPFLKRLGALVILVEEFPDEETLATFGLRSPFGLLGLYRGVDLTRKSGSDIRTGPDMIYLYRRPLLAAWARGQDSLEALVSHVLIHEIGHHFGLSDADMAAIERAAPPDGTG